MKGNHPNLDILAPKPGRRSMPPPPPPRRPILPQLPPLENVPGVRIKPEEARVGTMYFFYIPNGSGYKCTVDEIERRGPNIVRIRAHDENNSPWSFMFYYDEHGELTPDSDVILSIGQSGGRKRRSCRSRRSRRSKSRSRRRSRRN